MKALGRPVKALEGAEPGNGRLAADSTVSLRDAVADAVRLLVLYADETTPGEREALQGLLDGLREQYAIGPGPTPPGALRAHRFQRSDTVGVCVHCPLPVRNQIHQGG